MHFLKGYKTDGSYYDMYQVTSASGGGFTSLKNVSKVFKDNHNDVTPYNFKHYITPALQKTLQTP